MLQKFNTVLTGIIIGVILPSVLYYFFVIPTMHHYVFIGHLYGEFVLKLLPVFLSRCIFPNALLFFLLLWADQEKVAKGILISSAVMTAVLLFVNFLL
jgi:hypothetical protein